MVAEQDNVKTAIVRRIETETHLCPVCGKHKFKEQNSYEICPICNWEDDGVQVDDPDYAGGANQMSLNQARQAYKEDRKVT